MSEDYRYQRPARPDPSNLSDDTRAILHALNNGWVGRGVAMAFGFFLFGLVVWIVIFFAFGTAFLGVR